MIDFREIISRYKTKDINNLFSAYDIRPNIKYKSGLRGKRRDLIEKYYHSLDLRNKDDINKIVKLYEDILNDIEIKRRNELDHKERKIMSEYFEKLVLDLEKDGYVYMNNRIFLKSKLNKIDDKDIRRIWGNGVIKIFISHTSKYKEKASELKKVLSKYFISSFVAHNDIKPSKEWLIEIEKALRSADVLVALLYKGFSKSKWTDQEIGFAIGLQKTIIPLIFDIEPYGFFERYQGIKAKNLNFEQIGLKIFKMLFDINGIKQRLAEKYVECFENSDSFIRTREIFEVFQLFEDMPLDLIFRIRKAYKENDQIYNYAKSKEYMKYLTKKWTNS